MNLKVLSIKVSGLKPMESSLNKLIASADLGTNAAYTKFSEIYKITYNPQKTNKTNLTKVIKESFIEMGCKDLKIECQ